MIGLCSFYGAPGSLLSSGEADEDQPNIPAVVPTLRFLRMITSRRCGANAVAFAYGYSILITADEFDEQTNHPCATPRLIESVIGELLLVAARRPLNST
jgi:hypothetical protein